MKDDGLEKLEADELDVLVAEEVMGWRWCKSPGIGRRYDTFYLAEPEEHRQLMPEYVFTTSTLPINAHATTQRLKNTEESYSGCWNGAGKVVEKMQDGNKNLLSLTWMTSMSDDPRKFDWVAEFRRTRSVAFCDTAPRAICIAALRAVRSLKPSPAPSQPEGQR